MSVELSQAGRRAMILARLWGSRSAVSADLLALNDFRERVNRLIDLNVLQRGLVVPCSECERRAFYRIGTVAEKNACPRCGASAYATSGWRSGTEQAGEPGWFYDLHGAVRELLEQNGDVPFLAGWALAKTARSFEDIPELDFHWPGTEKPDEIDIAALVDGRMVIGEAKCVASLGTRKETNKAVQKLIRVSDLVGADEIVLATTASGPWEDLATSQLVKAVAAYGWRFGTTPRIRVLTDLRNAPQNTILS
jgi:hypothetical protein